MGPPAQQPLSSHAPERERRPELIRPEDRRRQFPQREAQRRLQQKEIAWAPVAYGVFFTAILVIFTFAYVSYAFSKYRGVILPGVHIDQIDVSGLTQTQAENAIWNQINSIGAVPVTLTYGQTLKWQPSARDIGFSPRVKHTVTQAMLVGRSETFFEQLLDRLPLHPAHTVPLLYSLTPPDQLRRYVVDDIAHGGVSRQGLFVPPQNARLKIDVAHKWHVYVLHAHPGSNLDTNTAVSSFHHALGTLSRVVIPLQVSNFQAQVTDADALSVRSRVENFLSHPPVISVGKRVLVTSRATFGPMFSFTEPTVKGHTVIRLNVDSNLVQSYISGLAAGVNRVPHNARFQFTGGQVQVVSERRTGTTMDQTGAFTSLLQTVTNLKPNARLHFAVRTTQPAIDTTNPASLGINHLLGTGRSSFQGASDSRLAAITNIAHSLDNTLIPPGGDISFNLLVGNNQPNNDVYNDSPSQANGQLAPGNGGAMQQMATTFLRAMYWAGLEVLERHAHTYRLPWYEPPIGLDAVVAPGRNWDLRFRNSTHHYLLLQTDVQAIRQDVTIYVFGPHLQWHVSVGPGHVTKTYPHGAQIIRQDAVLAPGDVRHLAFADDGAATTIRRTITLPDGSTHVDTLDTVYQPSQPVMAVGVAPTATPKPHTSKKATATTTTTPTTPTTTPTPASGATPTPTFSH